ncbi:hypothetical protein EVJ58_g9693 [Rhodofomes roseus]|uniref:Uncharacterized protein n=1 Tax=Rhodofomes roseus TaxID=34475 RepID=A0A4Y9XU98_9APHY|nr:hypothetical protein EVJ58_g9693 [Rhodofomes roseus]
MPPKNKENKRKTKEDKRYDYEKQLVPCLCADCKGRDVPRYTRRYHGGEEAPPADAQRPSAHEEIVKLDVAALLKHRKPKKLKVAHTAESLAAGKSSNTQPSQEGCATGDVEQRVPSSVSVDAAGSEAGPTVCHAEQTEPRLTLSGRDDEEQLAPLVQLTPAVQQVAPPLSSSSQVNPPLTCVDPAGPLPLHSRDTSPSANQLPAPDYWVDYDLPFGEDPFDYASRPVSPAAAGAPPLPSDAPLYAPEPAAGLPSNGNHIGPREGAEPAPSPAPEARPIASRDNTPPIATTAQPVVQQLPQSAAELLTESSNLWFWQLIMLLGGWLHLHYHLPHRGVALMLQVLHLIFVTVGLVKPEDRAPVTLRTTFSRLALEDNFQIRAMCPQCARLFPTDAASDSVCTKCKIPLFKEREDILGAAQKSRSSAARKPVKQVPLSVLSAQLVDLVPRLETSLERWRAMPPPPPGVLRCVQDGEIWQTLPGPPGDSDKPFFYNGPDRANASELRIGVTLAFDGFSYKKSTISSSHSTGAMSFCIANLDYHEKYNARNLVMSSLSPGPHELNAEQKQNFVREHVLDLLRLYDEGVMIRTPLFPEAFPPRTGEEHRRHAKAYAEAASTSERDKIFKETQARWFELHRLPYFDPIRMSVIDPMHNILLGIVKTHWLNAWIESKVLRERTATKRIPRELDQIHEYLQDFEMPAWVARVPKEVGYPAGGSLSADEWKSMLLNFCPVAVSSLMIYLLRDAMTYYLRMWLPTKIPLIWDEWQPSAQKAHTKTRKAWKKKDNARKTRIAKGKRRADGEEEPPMPEPKLRMIANDADVFLKLAAALKIILGRSIDCAELPRAQQLLQEYLLEFQEIADYGPVYGFWTFLTERLNKVLKSFSTNGRADGELEVTFFRSFSREVRMRRMLKELATTDPDNSTEARITPKIASMLLQTADDERGTVAALAHPDADVVNNLHVRFSLDTGVVHTLTVPEQQELLRYYHATLPQLHIVDIAETEHRPNAEFLNTKIWIHDHAILDGRRIVPSRGPGYKAPGAIIQANFNRTRWVGEIFRIFTHRQAGVDEPRHLLQVRWFKRLRDFDAGSWDA